MTTPLLEVRNVHVSYGGARALAGINFSVERGESVALIGANGAGKTSAIHAVVGLAPIESGDIFFDGQKINSLPAHRIAELGIRLVPEGRQLFSSISVFDNLRLGAYHRLQGRSKAKANEDLELMLQRFPVLRQRTAQLAGSLSGGEQQMLAIARALMGAPKLLLLDEPSIGLAPKVVEMVFETIRQLQTEGVTTLLVEQMATKALAVSKRAYVLELGRIALEGSSDEIRSNSHVEEAYLGGRKSGR